MTAGSTYPIGKSTAVFIYCRCFSKIGVKHHLPVAVVE